MAAPPRVPVVRRLTTRLTTGPNDGMEETGDSQFNKEHAHTDAHTITGIQVYMGYGYTTPLTQEASVRASRSSQRANRKA